jgi:hypothetical protein
LIRIARVRHGSRELFQIVEQRLDMWNTPGVTDSSPDRNHRFQSRSPTTSSTYPGLKESFMVDPTEHHTTSILAKIEDRFGLEPLSSRDAAVPDLLNVFSAR